MTDRDARMTAGDIPRAAGGGPRAAGPVARGEGPAPRAVRPIRDIAVLLIPGFAMISYACALEPFRAANQLSGRPLHRWRHVGPAGAGASAPCANGAALSLDGTVEDDDAPADLVLVCAAGDPARFEDAATFRWLRARARGGTLVAGVSGGPFLMARAGLLDGRRAAIHWEHAPALAEAHPRVRVTEALYEIDGPMLTCSGGTAPLDLTHALIAREHGRALADDVSDWVIHTNLRPGDGPQRLPVRGRRAERHPGLMRALAAMEAAAEAPPAPDDLAALAGVSRRQLERLFREHLGASIGAHSREIRLRRARALIAQSALSVTEVALGCGFASPAHFSRAYRARFGRPPAADRAPSARAAAPRRG